MPLRFAFLLATAPAAFRRMLCVAAGAGIGLLALLPAPAQAQPPGAPQSFKIEGLGQPETQLAGKWQYHDGDSAQWAAPVFDDSRWQQVDAALLEDNNLPYSQFSWYRTRIEINRQDPSQKLALLVDAVDTYAVYWNGQLIGQRGAVPPRFNWPRSELQVFSLPVPQQTTVSGVLTVRVWCEYPASDRVECGFYAPPWIGDAAYEESLQRHLVVKHFAGNILYYLLGLLAIIAASASLLIYLRTRTLRTGNDPLYLWFSVFLLAAASFESGYFNQVLPSNWGQAMISLTTGLLNASFLVLLSSLLGFQRDLRVRRIVLAVVFFTFADNALDALLCIFWAQAGEGMRIADATLSIAQQIMQLAPLPLLGVAIYRRKWRLNWPVIAASSVYCIVSMAVNLSYQWPGLIRGRLDWVDKNYPLGYARFTIAAAVFVLLLLTLGFSVATRFLAERRRQQHAEQELQSAREVQQVLVPEAIPAIPGYAIASVYQPAAEVGGDFFQIFPIQNEDVGGGASNGGSLVVIGDVSGKGMKAAMIVSLIVGTLRTVASFTQEPAEILSQLNDRLHGRLSSGFVTCLVLRIPALRIPALPVASSGEIILANAGHLSPYIDGREEPLAGSLPLGLVPGVVYEQTTLYLREGQTLTLLTDGVLEAQNAAREIFGFERLSKLLSNTPSAEQIAEAACNFGQEDDITVLTVTRLAESAPAQAATLNLTTQLA